MRVRGTRLPGSRRRLTQLAFAFAAVGVAALVFWVIVPRDTSEPTSVEAAIMSFREAEGTDGPAAPGMPEPGVYVYATRGFEKIDALTGASHEYPIESTITVTRGGCGLLMRWDVLENRSTAWDYCPSPAGRLVQSLTEVHAFFGTTDVREYTCDPESLALPPQLEAGTGWTTRCATGEITERAVWTVVGFERLTVGETQVETVHLREETAQSGKTTGAGVREWWLQVGTGLVVRQFVENDNSTSSTVGDVRYQEQYELRLASLEAQR